MCNRVHKGECKTCGAGFFGNSDKSYNARFRKIDKGRAWKVMYKDRSGDYKAAFTSVLYRPEKGNVNPRSPRSTRSPRSPRYPRPWLVWSDKVPYAKDGDGFCFFMHKKDAVEMCACLQRDVLYNVYCREERGGRYGVFEIEYSDGVGAFYSDESDGKLRRVGIAKRFRIIREVE